MQLSLYSQKAPRDLTRQRLLSKLKALIQLYRDGELGGTSHEVHPHLPKGSRENFLYFTLAPAINFQRKSEALWNAALKTYSDPETTFVFEPAAVAHGEEAFRVALTKHRLALQTHKHVSIWFTINKTLHERYDNDPRNVLSDAGYDVLRILHSLQQQRENFPYLNGPKLSNYWLYILSCFTDVTFVNRHEISVIPDVHVTRATQHLGLLPSDQSVTPIEVAETWKQFLEGTNISPSDLHAPLWRWSRRAFIPSLNEL
jgi:hypothetical protein